MGGPGPEHFIFIPGILMIGIVFGYILGSRSARADIARRQKRSRE